MIDVEEELVALKARLTRPIACHSARLLLSSSSEESTDAASDYVSG